MQVCIGSDPTSAAGRTTRDKRTDKLIASPAKHPSSWLSRSHSKCHTKMSLPSFLYSQIFVGLPVPDHDFTGQTIVITGGSTGLGLEAARHFLRLNASHIVLGVRNMEKGKEPKKTSKLQQIARTPSVSNTSIWTATTQSRTSPL